MKSRSNTRTVAAWRVLVRLSLVCIIPAALGMIWLYSWAETFFSLTRRVSADVLIVEGWIGDDGIQAAADEFKQGAYKYVVATGGLTTDATAHEGLTYAEMARRELVRSGIPESQIIVAATRQIERARTFNSAAAAWRALQSRGVHPAAINVLTLGPHARRTCLVYEKVYAPGIMIGIIAFVPSWYHSEPWWRSGTRTKCLLKETVGYPFELLLNSGRFSNSPVPATSPVTGHAVS
jgi:hypothetical protein